LCDAEESFSSDVLNRGFTCATNSASPKASRFLSLYSFSGVSILTFEKRLATTAVLFRRAPGIVRFHVLFVRVLPKVNQPVGLSALFPA